VVGKVDFSQGVNNGGQPWMLDAPHQQIQRPKGSPTPRETEVLQLVAKGLTNRQIASKLAISPATVKAHLAHLYSKLEVHSRVQALRKAMELGLFATQSGTWLS
jgi:DNA-binding NarL/FixJ family response regulator